ncbi:MULTISPECIES: TIGR01244 family sulfur transferase [Nitratireductor]|uniref:TIGR01244 family sulfur transferase n=1 Tax=Nitratireductor TaxID=245876 RepID=UPI000D0DA283|nr:MULTISPECIES: TIGR01244 family sulfur transferase [Nitratireductor]PSM18656.1 TIGR01244 family phosphatase [Nitratireductor sp. StC3]
MEIRQINQDFAVAGQIGAEHVQAIADAGFKSVVCNRPDSEEGAVPHDEVEAAVRAAGLEFRFIPVVSGAVTQDNVSEMAAALSALPRPVLAYCRTGGRCMNLYGLVQQTAG